MIQWEQIRHFLSKEYVQQANKPIGTTPPQLDLPNRHKLSTIILYHRMKIFSLLKKGWLLHEKKYFICRILVHSVIYSFIFDFLQATLLLPSFQVFLYSVFKTSNPANACFGIKNLWQRAKKHCSLLSFAHNVSSLLNLFINFAGQFFFYS